MMKIVLKYVVGKNKPFQAFSFKNIKEYFAS